MLEIVARMFRKQPAARTEALARQVVEASVEEVVRLVAGRIASMSLSEARGYVRARSATIVRRQTQVVLARHPHGDMELSAAVVPAATERLIPHVLRQTSSSTWRHMPPPLAIRPRTQGRGAA